MEIVVFVVEYLSYEIIFHNTKLPNWVTYSKWALVAQLYCSLQLKQYHHEQQTTSGIQLTVKKSA